MVIALFYWILVFAIFYLWGFMVLSSVKRLFKTDDQLISFGIDKIFFTGFLSLSVLTGILSLFLPVNLYIFISVCLITIIFLLLLHKPLIQVIKNAFRVYSHLSRIEKGSIIFFLLFLLTAATYSITFEDTITYHAQNIQWIQKYPVVPGLGNLHGRFAFNNMFFIISALFTFHVGNSIIFPINGICFLILALRLFFSFRKESVPIMKWESVFYGLMVLMSLLILFPYLNTPAADVSCTILVMYLFIELISHQNEEQRKSLIDFVFISILVFSCMTYKISSIFLVPAILFYFNSYKSKKLLISVATASLIFVPFLIRNYFLSGYLIYPFPQIDIFNVDWKIPIADVRAMKTEIECFAKLGGVDYDTVSKMSLHQWIIPWFKAMNFNTKVILIVNGISVFSFIIMLVKKDIYYAKIQSLIYLNLIFWINTAPDPRFTYGFLFAGFSITIAYLIKSTGIITYSSFIRIALVSLFIIIFFRRIKFPLETYRNTSLLLIPDKFGPIETVIYKSNFTYRRPVGDGCYNAEIPCVTYSLENVVLRGTELKQGFRMAGNEFTK